MPSLYDPSKVAALVSRLNADIRAHEVTGNGEMKRVQNIRKAIDMLIAQHKALDELTATLAAVRDDAMRADHQLCAMEARAEAAEESLSRKDGGQSYA